ncbi:hypothetical protein A0H81_10063 [Grifola frondosa]|uniref:Uncharacterized protein n=1 Tax=Grifola frondosa TaxID=5627 RepID=A0A1C7M0J4_GRIFR|nr:hypothetical protein A0H81_10063 [Grifola frondosa]
MSDFIELQVTKTEVRTIRAWPHFTRTGSAHTRPPHSPPTSGSCVVASLNSSTHSVSPATRHFVEDVDNNAVTEDATAEFLGETVSTLDPSLHRSISSLASTIPAKRPRISTHDGSDEDIHRVPLSPRTATPKRARRFVTTVSEESTDSDSDTSSSPGSLTPLGSRIRDKAKTGIRGGGTSVSNLPVPGAYPLELLESYIPAHSIAVSSPKNRSRWEYRKCAATQTSARNLHVASAGVIQTSSPAIVHPDPVTQASHRCQEFVTSPPASSTDAIPATNKEDTSPRVIGASFVLPSHARDSHHVLPLGGATLMPAPRSPSPAIVGSGQEERPVKLEPVPASLVASNHSLMMSSIIEHVPSAPAEPSSDLILSEMRQQMQHHGLHLARLTDAMVALMSRLPEGVYSGNISAAADEVPMDVDDVDLAVRAETPPLPWDVMRADMQHMRGEVRKLGSNLRRLADDLTSDPTSRASLSQGDKYAMDVDEDINGGAGTRIAPVRPTSSQAKPITIYIL